MLIKFEFCNNCVNRIYICIAIAHVYVECLSLIYSLFLLLMSRNICIKFKTILSRVCGREKIYSSLVVWHDFMPLLGNKAFITSRWRFKSR